MATMHVDGDECGARRIDKNHGQFCFVRLKPCLALPREEDEGKREGA